ncbi:MAG: phage portal protein [Rickettsiales bacterium]|nr:phage portal protein [Rickettsiales bacterium]
MRSFIARLFATKSTTTDLLQPGYATSYMHAPGKPVWMRRDYARFAQEAYARNVIAHRCIDLIAKGVASVKLSIKGEDARLSTLLARPNPRADYASFMRDVISHQMIAGNAYIHAVGPKGEAPLELHTLRPDRVAVIAGAGGVPQGYQYKVGEKVMQFPVDPITGASRILHLKQFHPLDDWYGLSPVEAAAYAIDQHNQSAAWNQSLLQHGARPSGALVVNRKEGAGQLSEEQYYRLKQQMDEQFSGTDNAGRPLLLEGGLEWREMSHSPKDMDFIEAKHSAAREIALAFGVPPQLLGIPGDNTYANLAEARLALWEQIIMPMTESVCGALNYWLLPNFGNQLELNPNYDAIPALAPRREKMWERINNATFLSDEEKREKLGF